MMGWVEGWTSIENESVSPLFHFGLTSNGRQLVFGGLFFARIEQILNEWMRETGIWTAYIVADVISGDDFRYMTSRRAIV